MKPEEIAALIKEEDEEIEPGNINEAARIATQAQKHMSELVKHLTAQNIRTARMIVLELESELKFIKDEVEKVASQNGLIPLEGS
jgi:hypothetical protein